MVWGKRFLRHLRGVHGGRGFPPRGALTRGACWLCCCLDSVQGMVQVRAVLRLVEFLKAVAFLSCLIRQLGDKYRGVGCEACSFSPFLNPLLLNSGASFPTVSVSKSPMWACSSMGARPHPAPRPPPVLNCSLPWSLFMFS